METVMKMVALGELLKYPVISGGYRLTQNPEE
jgi:hypothetical protein